MMSLPMNRRGLLAAIASMPLTPLALASDQTLQVPSQGRVERLENFPSKFVASRNVDVWLPADYPDKVRAKHQFAVLYMHDGQMLFDAAHTWNHQSWNVDVAATGLMAAHRTQDFIIVGPWNNDKLRHSEYFPAQFLPHLPSDLRQSFIRDKLQGQVLSDAYLRFLVEELKPAIDAQYATLPGREHCFLAGSSMGGLISMYGLCEYPNVFGGAGCMSTHWIATFERNPEFPAAAMAYLNAALPQPDNVRIWTDRGTSQVDELYDEAHAAVTRLLHDKGFRAPRFQSRVFEGTGHNEVDWSKRVHLTLEFLLGQLART